MFTKKEGKLIFRVSERVTQEIRFGFDTINSQLTSVKESFTLNILQLNAREHNKVIGKIQNI